MEQKKKKIFVGLSGGVDSAVSAALLKEDGHEVVGVFIKAWQPPFLACSSKDDQESAMRVAAHLDIPFIMKDWGEEYRALVVEYMVSAYRAGRTPNPDVMCNKMIKFGLLYRFAMGEGVDAIATGHYARVRERAGAAPARLLLTGADPKKDQSYFLWTLTQDILAHALFPVGGFQKKEVRALAKKMKLPNAERKDSQGVCILGNISMRDFLRHFIEEKRGEVLNSAGQVVGRHEGAAFLTIGQRKGFSMFHNSPLDPPQYIISKDVEKNTITVGAYDEQRANTQQPVRIFLEEEHWIDERPHEGKSVMVRTRYRGPLFPARYVSNEGKSFLELTTHDAFAPGQSAVCYDKEVCLGGGVIGAE